jgi:glycerol-3-phosphate acyltransferase PlsY
MGVGVSAISGTPSRPGCIPRGKGAATGAGAMIALLGWWALAPLALFVLIVATTRYVSLGSLFTALLIAAMMLSVPALRPYWPLGLAGALIVLWTHRGNIERLLAGTENRLGARAAAAEQGTAADRDRTRDG